MYGLIPVGISYWIGADFLIGDFVDAELIKELCWFTGCSAFFLTPLLYRNIVFPSFNFFGRFSEALGFKIYFNYLVILVLLGLSLRLLGFGRSDLLRILSLTFIQGMGIVLLFFYLRFIRIAKMKYLIIAILSIFIDLLFMGKQYFISLVTISVYLFDLYNIKIKVRHIFFSLGISTFFVFVVNFTRGDFDSIDLFSSLMEFRGVVSSIQFNYEGFSYTDFDRLRALVELNSVDTYGYNLAFHPILFFRSIGENTVGIIVAYSLVAYLIVYLAVRLSGVFGVMIIALNFIHFLRHGIDLFIIKVLVQVFIVVVFRLNWDFTKIEIMNFVKAIKNAENRN
jgi:hypothetical protein